MLGDWKANGPVSVGLEQAEKQFVLKVRETFEMGRVAWQDRIVIAPDLHHGDPCIKGTRIPVAMIVGSLADGMTVTQIREAYPQLADEDVRAALSYAAELTHEEILIPLPA